MIKGIDVSKWQGSINWKNVAKTEFKFAILRASYGTDGVDPFFKTNAENAVKAGIPVGAYHYCYATTVSAAKKEAAHFLNTIKGTALAYPTVLDIEDKTQEVLDKKLLTDIALAFLSTLKEAGYYAIVYASKYFAQSKLDMGRLSEYDFWLAQYREGGHTYLGEVAMWQYTSSGRVNGISGDVDCNECYKDYPAIIKKGGYNHWKGESGMEEEMTVAKAKEIIQKKTGFDDNTMLYLEFYRYSESMIKRLAAAMQG